MDPNAPQAVTEVIELAVAPVFLLVAIGSFLNVMTQRLARAIDRARALEDFIAAHIDEKKADACRAELAVLDQRMLYAQRAISASAVAALVIAFLVALIFLSDMAGYDATRGVAVLFVLAMAAIIVALGYFLLETNIATRTIRVRGELLTKK